MCGEKRLVLSRFSHRLERSVPVVGTFLLGSFFLLACSPLNTPTPTVTLTVIVPTSTASLTPTPAPSLTPTPIPTPACFSQPGRLVDGVIETDLLPKPMTYHVYL